MTTEENPEEQLQALAEAAKTARLSPADEDRAAGLLKDSLGGGPKVLPPALEAMAALPWSIGVKAVSEAWPEMKPTARTRLLGALAKMDSEGAKRLRLSLARGLHSQDAAAAQKLILAVVETMLSAEGGASPRDRQIFANVLLGKARPWLMNLALGELKPAEAQKVIEATLESLQQAPVFTQIWVLRWIADAEKFDAVPLERMDALAKSIQRWQPRWRKELRKIAPKLPPALEISAPEPQQQQKRESAPQAEPAAEEEEESDASGAGEQQHQHQQQNRPQRGRQQERAARREPERKPQQGPFDLGRALREIDNYVGRLQSEMQLLQAASRRRESPPPPRSGIGHGGAASSAEAEELRRHNEQLQEQNAELRHQLEELASDHEDRAATLSLDDAIGQFKALLALKLKEDFADFQALSRESLTEVVRRHAQELLGHIFKVLEGEGVRLGE